ncbi:MAG: DUF551 domain-containing protein, partial [Proteobacteria bacterium]|nr:DUF551 domain-containing protein [Pseudomonadota bacterium]
THYKMWIGVGDQTSDTRALKQFPPTHWKPLPAPPQAKDTGK